MKKAPIICSECGSSKLNEVPDAGLGWIWNLETESYQLKNASAWFLECGNCSKLFDEQTYKAFVHELRSQGIRAGADV